MCLNQRPFDIWFKSTVTSLFNSTDKVMKVSPPSLLSCGYIVYGHRTLYIHSRSPCVLLDGRGVGMGVGVT